MTDRTVSVALRAQISDYVAKMTAAGKSTRELESAGRDLRKALIEEEDAAGRARVAEERLTSVRKDGKASVAQIAAAEEDHAASLRKVELAQDRTRAATERYAAASKKAANDVQDSGARMEDAASKYFDRANKSFNLRNLAIFSAGVPALAAAGGAAVAGSLALMGAGFAAVGVVALKNSADIQDRMQQLGQNVSADVKQMAEPLRGELVAALDTAAAGWDSLAPAVQRGVAASKPAVRELTGAIVDFAQNAMPGLVTAAESSEPALQGVRSFLALTGQGLGEFASNASTASQSAGTDMRDLGGITHDLLGQAGTLFANLATGAHGSLPQFGGALHQVLDTADTLTSNGMPLLNGATNGLLGTLGGGINIVNGFAAGLGSWSAPLGTIGGNLFATNAIAKMFGTSLGETGFGVKAFSTTIDDAGKKTSPFKEALADADKNGNSKFKAGVKSVVSNGLDPLGLALGLGGLLLAQWGQASQEAAAQAAAFAAGVADIKGTLSSSGAITQNTRAREANRIQTEKLGVSQRTGAQLLGEYGVSQQVATDAMTGSSGALDRFNYLVQNNVAGIAKATLSQNDWNTLAQAGISTQDLLALSTGNAAAGFNNIDDAVQKTSGSTDDYMNSLHFTLGAIASATQGQRDLSNEVREQAKESAEAQRQMRALGDAATFSGGTLKLSANDAAVLSGALATLGDATKSVTDQGSALTTVLDTLSGKNLTLSAAQAASTKAMSDTDAAIKNIRDSGGKLKGTFTDLVNGAGGINGLTTAGANLQGVFGTLSTAMGTEVAAAAAESKASGDSLGVTFDKTGAIVDRTRGKFIDAAKAAGLTGKQANDLADKLGLIPNEVNIALAANGDSAVMDKLATVTGELKKIPPNHSIHLSIQDAAAAQALKDLGYKVETLPDGSFDVRVNTIPADTGITLTVNKANRAKGTITLDANGVPADNKLTFQLKRADGSTGTMTYDARNDPATNKLQVLVQNVNGSWGWMNIDAFNNAAKSVIGDTVRVANGSKGYIQVGANTGAALASIYSVTNGNYTATISVRTSYPDGHVSVSRATAGYADGGLVTHRSARGYASGGPMDVTGGGLLSGPGGPRDDRLPLWGSDGEFMVNAKDTAKNLPWLMAINRGAQAPKMADGGMLSAAKEMLAQLRGNGQFFEDFSFYGNSSNVSAYNDKLAKMYYSNGGGFDQNSGPAIEQWLQNLIGGQGTGVQQKILSGSAAVQQMPIKVVIQQPPAPTQRGSGQPSVTINTAQTDPNRLAAAMVSALAWQMR